MEDVNLAAGRSATRWPRHSQDTHSRDNGLEDVMGSLLNDQNGKELEATPDDHSNMEVRTLGAHEGQEATATTLGHVDSDDMPEDTMPRGNDDLTVLQDMLGDESNDRHQQPGQHTDHKPHQHERDADNNNDNNAPQATQWRGVASRTTRRKTLTG